VQLDGVAVEGEVGGVGDAVITVTEEATLRNVGISLNDGPGLNIETPTGTVTLDSVSVSGTRGVTVYNSPDVRASDLSVTHSETAFSVTDSTVDVSQSSLSGEYIGVVSAGDNTLVVDDSTVFGGNRSVYLTATHSGTTVITNSSLSATNDEVIKLGFYSTFYGTWQNASGRLLVSDSDISSSGIPAATVAYDGTDVDLANNWWGQETGPDPGTVTGPDASEVTVSPWCTNSSCSSATARLSDTILESRRAAWPEFSTSGHTNQILTMLVGRFSAK
jgi:hypothetical protein